MDCEGGAVGGALVFCAPLGGEVPVAFDTVLEFEVLDETGEMGAGSVCDGVFRGDVLEVLLDVSRDV